MTLNRLHLKNVGQIKSASIEFGELTVLVGRQATGKTIFLEFLKLILDRGHVHAQLNKYGSDWNGDHKRFLELYLGEGMHTVWTDRSEIAIDGNAESLDSYIRYRGDAKHNYVFYIPAQRVLTFSNSWPRPFDGYGPQDPYVVKEFSEQFRLMMNKEFSRGDSLFPKTNRLKQPCFPQ